jgi:anaerobic ribonucleoside-triphosphate reductase activating protein
MYINQIVLDDLINSDGLAITIVMQGCDRIPKCVGCHSPHTWNMQDGIEISHSKLVYMIERQTNSVNYNWYDNLVILGGEPLAQRDTLFLLLYMLNHKNNYDFKLKVWLYTSYEFDDIPKDILDLIDVVKTGRYDENLKQNCFPASSNQKLFKKINGAWVKENK